ncbi:MAG: hydroxymethylbilane synthase [Chloroflexi bacterium]|nr:hydroxymethylbilane synthase [Chloroflexota bacterium]MCI0580457.1 hydroxymethylbilane synthase [Chloroflexota bacterium]MCI0649201.1 hydroxymethylbilane synthase [Chloroflexota bacterium]MCI0727987.1 hydroxymethylbilane synthase [Chloroflexota bacterium]
MNEIRLGSRTSRLAMWQTNHVVQQLQVAWPGLVCQVQPFLTKGDQTPDEPLPHIGGKGLFTAELERALRLGEIDLAVHSLKDLPVDGATGLTLGAIVGRGDVRDVLVANDGWTLATLPQGAAVGTSSLRRQAQLLAHRPELRIRSMRGNVESRVRKVLDGAYDAAVLAAAGIIRLGLEEYATDWLPLDVFCPAPGQGALAVQCRAGDKEIIRLLAAIDNAEVRRCVSAERAFLHGLGGGCATPVAAYATIEAGRLSLAGLVASPDGRVVIRVNSSGDDPQALGLELARQARQQGAEELLAHV